METIADVVIIGAGAIGSSTAYHLAKAGIKKVIILDMGKVGSGTSGKSASMLTLQLSNPLSIQMGKYSYERYMSFEDDLGKDIGLKKIGYLALATAETAQALLRRAELLQSLGVQTDLLTPDDIKHEYPEIDTSDIVLATWGPDDGKFDPHMIMQGYIGKACQLGATLYEDVKVVDIHTENGRIKGVLTDQGFITTPIVVNAAGPWAVNIGKFVNIDIPIINSARSILVTGPFAQIPASRPCIEDMTSEWYFRPEGPGILMGMGALPTETLDVSFNENTLVGMLQAALHRVPILKEATQLTAWTGVRPMTLDDCPILGPVPAVEGFLLNCGWGGEGIMQSPLAGQLIAELVCHGKTLTFDIEPFHIDRFTELNVSEVTDLRIFARQDIQGRT